MFEKAVRNFPVDKDTSDSVELRTVNIILTIEKNMSSQKGHIPICNNTINAPQSNLLVHIVEKYSEGQSTHYKTQRSKELVLPTWDCSLSGTMV